MVILLEIIQYVAALLGSLAASVFHHSWLLRRFPSRLFECWRYNSDPAAFPSCPPPPIILWLVSLDRGNEDCLIIASASSWISSKLEPVWFAWTQAADSCHLCDCIWLPALTSSHPLYSPILFSVLCKFPISPFPCLRELLRLRKVYYCLFFLNSALRYFTFTSHRTFTLGAVQ